MATGGWHHGGVAMSELTERERAGGTGSAGAGSNGHGDDDAATAVATVDAPPRPDEEVDEPDVDAGRPTRRRRRHRDRSPWYARAGRRVVRRPVEWARRPWPTSRTVRFAVTAVTLIITTVVMMNVVHLNPLNMRSDLIFDDNTPTGGDMGAHVWGPAFLRDNLLPHWQLSGWSMDWYAGFPMYRFYMVVPALAIVALDAILPYGVAFKLVAVSGLVTLPLCCWAFGRLARFRYPLPELFAVRRAVLRCWTRASASTAATSKSTMAGEFSFSIALSLMILGLGLAGAGDADRRQAPQLGGDRAGAGGRLPRHRRHLRRWWARRSSCSSTSTRSGAWCSGRASGCSSSCCRRGGSGRSSATTST